MSKSVLDRIRGIIKMVEELSSQQLNNSYRTPTKRWQKTSDFPKGKKLPMYLGRAKEKRKKQRQNNKDGTCTFGWEL